VRRFVNIGSQLIINLANDGWYGISDAPYQHLEIARLRAIENRRYLLRATNSGISAIIEPTGRIQASTGVMKEAVCLGKFDFINAITFYTRYGDVFVFLCAIILVCLIFNAEYSRYKSVRTPAKSSQSHIGIFGGSNARRTESKSECD
jgi:apolipoprotein N-acyltransferase